MSRKEFQMLGSVVESVGICEVFNCKMRGWTLYSLL